MDEEKDKTTIDEQSGELNNVDKKLDTNESNRGFVYGYTAPTPEERSEIEDIRRRYAKPEEKEDKLKRLRSLDNRAKNIPFIVSLSLGIVGALLFGVGLTMVLEWNILVWGIIVMLIGCVPIGFAHPVHVILLNRGKKKYGDEILKLSEELLNIDSSDSNRS